VSKIALLAVNDRKSVRDVFESQFAQELKRRGVGAITSFNLVGLADIKADRPAAAARLKAAGADSVLVVRLVDSQTFEHNVRQTSPVYAPVITGMGAPGMSPYYSPYYNWGTYYDVAFMDMSVIRNTSTTVTYLEYNLYDLATEKLIWAGVTKTTLKDDADRVASVRPLADKILEEMRTAGVIR
jgi:hypothetical protein